MALGCLTPPFFHLRRAVQGHHDHPHGREWMNITDHVNPLLAELIGAKFLTLCVPALVHLLWSWPKVRAKLRSLAWAV